MVLPTKQSQSNVMKNNLLKFFLYGKYSVRQDLRKDSQNFSTCSVNYVKKILVFFFFFRYSSKEKNIVAIGTY